MLASFAQGFAHFFQKFGIKGGRCRTRSREADRLDTVVNTEMIPFFILLTQAVGTVADHRPGNAEAFHGLGMPEVLAGQKSGLFFQRHLSNQITNVLYIHMSPLFVHASCNRSTVLRSQGSWILGTSEISRFVYGASGSSMTLSGFPLSTNLPCSIIYTESEM